MAEASIFFAVFRIMVVHHFNLGLVVSRHCQKDDIAGALMALKTPDFHHAHLATIEV